jgi:HEPN domain-containing protein
MGHDAELIAETKAWLAKATRDLAAAAYELKADPPFAGDAVFHAQQAVEKGLKGFLTWHGQLFGKTHNLTELGERCAKLDPTLQPIVRPATRLTEYAWKYPYPGEPDEPSRQEAEEALATARQVCEALLSRLPGEARP